MKCLVNQSHSLLSKSHIPTVHQPVLSFSYTFERGSTCRLDTRKTEKREGTYQEEGKDDTPHKDPFGNIKSYRNSTIISTFPSDSGGPLGISDVRQLLRQEGIEEKEEKEESRRRITENVHVQMKSWLPQRKYLIRRL